MRKNKWFVVSITQSIEAKTKEEALKRFEYNINVGNYESESFDVEETTEDTK